MNQCYNSGDFKKYFNENMSELGLPVPSTLFDSFNAAVSNAALMAEALQALGKGATVGELIGATTGLEKLKVAAALGASACRSGYWQYRSSQRPLTWMWLTNIRFVRFHASI